MFVQFVPSPTLPLRLPSLSLTLPPPLLVLFSASLNSNLHEPHLYTGSDRASQGADYGVEFEPGVDLGLGLLGDDEMAMDEDGAAWGGRGAAGSSSAGGLGLEM